MKKKKIIFKFFIRLNNHLNMKIEEYAIMNFKFFLDRAPKIETKILK